MEIIHNIAWFMLPGSILLGSILGLISYITKFEDDPISEIINDKSWIEKKDFELMYEQPSIESLPDIESRLEKANTRHELEYGKDFGNDEPTILSGAALAFDRDTNFKIALENKDLEVPTFAKCAGKLQLMTDLMDQKLLTKKQAKKLLGFKDEKKKTKAKRRLRVSTGTGKSRTKIVKSKSSKAAKKGKQRVS